MSKGMLVGDPHLTESQIVSRRDSTRITSLNKLRQVVNIAIREKVLWVLFLGDLFHLTIQTKTFQRDVIKILAALREAGITGNHVGDTVYKQHESYKDKDIGLLQEAGLLNVVDTFDTGVGLCACYHAYTSLADLAKRIGPEDSQKVTQIAIHHHLQPMFNDTLVVTLEDIRQFFPSVSTVWQGHDHSEFYQEVARGIHVCRPGSLLRTDSSASSNRIPRIIIFSPLDPDSIWIKEVRLDAEPYEKVFNLDAKVDRANYAEELDGYMSIIGQAKQEHLNLEDYIFEVVDHIQDKSLRSFMYTDLESLGITRRAI